MVFTVTRLIQRLKFARRGVLRMTSREQQKKGLRQRMSMVLWDTFTGSTPYRDIFLRTIHPLFLVRFLWESTIGFIPVKTIIGKVEENVEANVLGRLYKDGETVINQGESGDCMYVIQSGNATVVQFKNGTEVVIAELGEGDFFGEMALFESKIRSATIRSHGGVRVVTVDKKILLLRIQEDPSMAFHIMQTTIGRLRNLTDEISSMKANDRRNLDTRKFDCEK